MARPFGHAYTVPPTLPRGVLRGHGFHELRITGIAFPREFVIVLPAVGEPPANVGSLVELLTQVARA